MSYIYILVFALLSFACRTSQKEMLQEKSFTQEKSFQRELTDSIVIEKISPISDTIFIPIAPIVSSKKNCDSLCNEELQRVLRSVERRNKHGGNNYGVYYDQYKKQLILYNEQAAQLNQYRVKLQQISEKEKRAREHLQHSHSNQASKASYLHYLFSFLLGYLLGFVLTKIF